MFFYCQQVPNYLSHVDKRLNEESERLLHYLDNSTRYEYLIFNGPIYMENSKETGPV